MIPEFPVGRTRHGERGRRYNFGLRRAYRGVAGSQCVRSTFPFLVGSIISVVVVFFFHSGSGIVVQLGSVLSKKSSRFFVTSGVYSRRVKFYVRSCWQSVSSPTHFFRFRLSHFHFVIHRAVRDFSVKRQKVSRAAGGTWGHVNGRAF